MSNYKKVPKIKRDDNGEYPFSFKQQVNNAIRLESPKYMIATQAEHLLGDISRDFSELSAENLCFITKEMPDYYVGAWCTGYGFIDVAYPKKTTRELTDKEVNHFNGKYIQLASFPPQKLKVD